MIGRLVLGASFVLFLSATPTGPFAGTDLVAQTPPPQAAQSAEQASPQKPDMKKMHEQMMSSMKAADGKLEALVTKMNAASGPAKVDAVAAVVTELVAQQKTMHTNMASMHEQMMGGGGMMMKK